MEGSKKNDKQEDCGFHGVLGGLQPAWKPETSSETWNNQMKAGGPSWVARRGQILARF